MTSEEPKVSSELADLEQKSSGYISNPFALLSPSWQAIKINLLSFLLPVIASILLIIGFASVLLVALIGGKLDPRAILANPAALQKVIVGYVVIMLVLIVVSILIAPYPVVVALASLKGKKIGIGEAITQTPKYSWRFVQIAFMIGWPLLVAVAAMVVLVSLKFTKEGGFDSYLYAVILPIILVILPTAIWILYRAIIFSLAPYKLVEADIEARDALERSKILVKGHFIETAGLIVLPQAFKIVPLLGNIISAVVGLLMPAATLIRMQQLDKLKQSNTPKPSIHWANYAVIVLALLASGMTSREDRNNNQMIPNRQEAYQLDDGEPSQ